MNALRILTPLVLFLLYGANISAQSRMARQPSIQADVATVYTLPDGTQVRWTGRYYRSQFGQIREDSGLGAVITDSKAGTVTMLIAETRQAHIMRIPASERNPSKAHRPAHERFEETMIDGRKISKFRSVGPQGQRVEFWTAPDLGLVTLATSESNGVLSSRELKNISTLEPEPELFMIPADYTVTELNRPNSAPGLAIPPRAGRAAGRGRGPGGLQ